MTDPDDRNPLRWLLPLATVVILVSNLANLGLGVAPNLDARIVDIGGAIWPGYATDLRNEPEPPDCDLAALQKQVAVCPADAAPSPGTPSGDPFGGEDPFAEPGTPAPPKPPEPPKDPFGGEDPFAEPGSAPPKPPPAPADPKDPFAGEDPFAEPAPAGGDPFAEEAAPKVNCAALLSLTERCELRQKEYASATERLTPSIRAFRTFELGVSAFAQFPWEKQLLALVFLAAALSTTVHRVHVALRNPASLVEYRVSQVAQFVAHVLLTMSCGFDWDVQRRSSAESQDPELPILFGVGFAILAVVNVVNLIRAPRFEGKATIGRILMVIPLYAWLVVMAGIYFLAVEQHYSGLAIYLHKFVEYPKIYLGIALYVWAGMLLSETRSVALMFDVAQPWRPAPHLLAWVVSVISAVPTAYSGASGIFVISTGRVVFERLREAGASRRVALGATAMSGSLGVVLRPCLIIVLISVLNKQVTTDDLFRNGFYVFLVTAILYLVAMMMRKEGKSFDPLPDAAGVSARALGALAPYAVIGALTLAFYALVFKMNLNENTASMILPVMLLLAVAWDRMRDPAHAAAAPKSAPEAVASPLAPEPRSLLRSLTNATDEASHNAGALLAVMVGSVAFGGIVERSGVMDGVPTDLGSPPVAMAFLVVAMILVGMAVDALGAVILVSITLAPIAYGSGIDPIHFWMMGLVAFELGYLHPPVGLNILLARQVIGHEAHLEHFPSGGSFFEEYEHVIVPCLVMGAALIIVAFVPFLFY